MYEYTKYGIFFAMVFSFHQPVRSPYLRTAIVGVSGFAGLTALRLLENHPVFSVTTVCAGSQAGQALHAIWPHLAGIADLTNVVVKPSTGDVLEGHDVVFLATPHDVAAQLAGPLVNQGALVVDLSGGHRLSGAGMIEWYGLTHPHSELLPAIYGLPELVDLREARLIAGPRCYPTATVLGLAPFLDVIDLASISTVGLSGLSGAGRLATEPFSFVAANENTRVYGSPGHRHTPEIERILGELSQRTQPPIRFTPHVVPQTAGLVATSTADLIAPVDPLQQLRDYYADQPFITVTPSWPETGAVVGSNRAMVHAQVDTRANSLIVSCAIDNTIKGASGQGIQAANAALGLDQTLGLPRVGTYL